MLCSLLLFYSHVTAEFWKSKHNSLWKTCSYWAIDVATFRKPFWLNNVPSVYNKAEFANIFFLYVCTLHSESQSPCEIDVWSEKRLHTQQIALDGWETVWQMETNGVYIWQEWIKASTKCAAAVRTKKWKWPCLVSCPCASVSLSVTPSLAGSPPHAGVVLCLISCFSLKCSQLSPHPFFCCIFLPLPHRLLTPLFFSAPSSHPPPSPFYSFYLSSAFITSETTISRLSFCFSLILLPLLFLFTSCSRPDRCYAVYPCITVTTLPAPAVRLFLGELTCEWRAL